MALTPEARHHHHRARVAALTRHHPDHPELADADRLQLKHASVERYLRRVLDEWPALTIQQRAELARMLLKDASP
jgi:hypothetical protein